MRIEGGETQSVGLGLKKELSSQTRENRRFATGPLAVSSAENHSLPAARIHTSIRKGTRKQLNHGAYSFPNGI